MMISEIHKKERNLFFYVNLLYIKLFIMHLALIDSVRVEFNKKMINAMEIQAK